MSPNAIDGDIGKKRILRVNEPFDEDVSPFAAVVGVGESVAVAATAVIATTGVAEASARRRGSSRMSLLWEPLWGRWEQLASSCWA